MAAPKPPSREGARDAEATRARLVNAAKHLIAEQGWAAATSRAIAAQAGVNAALINYHFGGKAKLLSASIDSAMAWYRRAASRRLCARVARAQDAPQ
ncbi:MAG: TetR family transcriptional regulator [Nannocystaceae bacterium]